ncbi:hypothetical protein FOL47_011102 [Perkinsus chesapeaki]|uniref:Uncharacterized protein n=1 Tax=Perkinsus chesapeaki TaxID=330153 RepID=A0A7J6MN48_PERCH|nr:hypothetical protein FOL47_011102 [Perkinsus chesapeaki]
MPLLVILSILCSLAIGESKDGLPGIPFPTGTFKGYPDATSQTAVSVSWQVAKTPTVILKVTCEGEEKSSVILHYKEPSSNDFIIDAASQQDYVAFIDSVKGMRCDRPADDGNLDHLLYDEDLDVLVGVYSSCAIALQRDIPPMSSVSVALARPRFWGHYMIYRTNII